MQPIIHIILVKLIVPYVNVSIIVNYFNIYCMKCMNGKKTVFEQGNMKEYYLNIIVIMSQIKAYGPLGPYNLLFIYYQGMTIALYGFRNSCPVAECQIALVYLM